MKPHEKLKQLEEEEERAWYAVKKASRESEKYSDVVLAWVDLSHKLRDFRKAMA